MKTISLLARVIVIAIVALFLLRFVASAQQPQAPDMSIDTSTRKAVIENLLRELNDSYVFAETAKQMETSVLERMKRGEYDGVTAARAFAEKLTQDLQAVSKDKHLRVRFSAQPIPIRPERSGPTAEEKEQNAAFGRRVNFGFEKVERLQGNIGYIDLRGFMDHEAGAETVAAAMGFLANTDALIFDLRQNGGGSPDMVKLISSYLFGDKPVHLNDLYWRKGGKTESYWTVPTVAGKKYGARDIYVLTSNRTFSAGEEFTYNLKNLKRATIIGETTGGGAHPGGMVRLSDHFGVFIPSGRAINPVSKTNWEGTGVEPDVKVPKEQALKVAHVMALSKSLEAVKGDEAKEGLKRMIDQLQKEIDEMKKMPKGN